MSKVRKIVTYLHIYIYIYIYICLYASLHLDLSIFMTDMDRVYMFLLHSLECVYYVLLMSYLRTTLTSTLRTLYEKKRAFTAITAVLSSSSSSSSSTSFYQLLDLADEKSNVTFIGEIARLIHKDIDYTLENNMPSLSSPSPATVSSPSSASSSTATLTSVMSVNEITALIGEKHIDGILYPISN